MIDGIVADTRLKDGERVFAIAVLQHVNITTGLAWPSLARIAAIMGCGYSTAKRHSAKLASLGWLDRERQRRQGSYFYTFNDEHLEDIKQLSEERTELADIEEQRRYRLNAESSLLTPWQSRRELISRTPEGSYDDSAESSLLTPEHLDTELPIGTPLLAGQGKEIIEVSDCGTVPETAIFDRIAVELGKLGCQPEEIRSINVQSQKEDWSMVDADIAISNYQERKRNESV
ncbi:MAG: hypothetical protein COB78_09960 [Hyphomicrobiales bacterium]|nr:MAG: hypothetical protein COB78_09960 [Hyphomicrobiales bacterium]